MSGRLERVALDDAIARTEAVVVARPLDPPHRFVEIPISPDGAHPPFRRILYRYRIEEVLQGVLAAGSEIEVDKPAWGYDLTVHKKRYLEGVNKITIHEAYESSLTHEDLKADTRQILLLNQTQEGWEFTCPGSIEPLRLRAEIERRLHK